AFHKLRCSPKLEFLSSTGACLPKLRRLPCRLNLHHFWKSIFPKGLKLREDRCPAFHKCPVHSYFQNGFYWLAEFYKYDFDRLQIGERYRPYAPKFLGQRCFRL